MSTVSDFEIYTRQTSLIFIQVFILSGLLLAYRRYFVKMNLQNDEKLFIGHMF